MSLAVRLVGGLVIVATAIGAATLVAAAIWMTYGVFARYVLHNPDRMVTEATGLLLVPLAFAGVPIAMRDDAFPTVTVLLDNLPPLWQRILGFVHLLVMLVGGVFFTAVATWAAIRTYFSGSSSEVLSWPEFIFWVPVAISVAVFTLVVLVRLLTDPFPHKQRILE